MGCGCWKARSLLGPPQWGDFFPNSPGLEGLACNGRKAPQLNPRRPLAPSSLTAAEQDSPVGGASPPPSWSWKKEPLCPSLHNPCLLGGGFQAKLRLGLYLFLWGGEKVPLPSWAWESISNRGRDGAAGQLCVLDRPPWHDKSPAQSLTPACLISAQQDPVLM